MKKAIANIGAIRGSAAVVFFRSVSVVRCFFRFFLYDERSEETLQAVCGATWFSPLIWLCVRIYNMCAFSLWTKQQTSRCPLTTAGTVALVDSTTLRVVARECLLVYAPVCRFICMPSTSMGLWRPSFYSDLLAAICRHHLTHPSRRLPSDPSTTTTTTLFQVKWAEMNPTDVCFYACLFICLSQRRLSYCMCYCSSVDLPVLGTRPTRASVAACMLLVPSVATAAVLFAGRRRER